MARFSTEVYAMSKTYPSRLSSSPAAWASRRPFSVRSTSVQPVNRLSRFHWLSPWRSSTSLYMGEAGMRGEVDAYSIIRLFLSAASRAVSHRQHLSHRDRVHQRWHARVAAGAQPRVGSCALDSAGHAADQQ